MTPNSSAVPELPTAATLDPVDKRIIVTLSIILILLAALMVFCLGLQWYKYDRAIEIAIKASPPDHAAALSYARALDAAVIKTCALMLAFIVVFLGALYVLRTATAAFNLGLTGQGLSGTLQTTSPGLVMVTLGLVIVAIVVLTRSDINYAGPSYAIPQAASSNPSRGEGPDQPVPATPTLPMENSNGHSNSSR